MKRILFAVFVALPAVSSAREDESAWRQLCQNASPEMGCEGGPRIAESIGRARRIVRAAPAPQPQSVGSGRVTGSGYFDPMEAGRHGVGVIHLQGEISVSRPDGARGVVRVRGVGSIPDDAVDGTAIHVRLTGSGEMTLNGRPAGRESVDMNPQVSLRVSGTYVTVEQVVSFGTPREPFNCEAENPPAPSNERVP